MSASSSSSGMGSGDNAYASHMGGLDKSQK